jgi:hypothetical protein
VQIRNNRWLRNPSELLKSSNISETAKKNNDVLTNKLRTKNFVECFLDAYEQTYIHFAKYELFLIILITFPKFIITHKNADSKCLQAHDLHTNYTQLHADITVAIYDHTTIITIQILEMFMTADCTETSTKATCYCNDNSPGNTGGTFPGDRTIGT